MSLITAVVLALAGAHARRAHACSCGRPTLKRRLVTPAGNVPTNAVLRVYLTGGFPVPLRRSLATEYRLRDPRGRIIALTGKTAATRLDMKPRRGALAPNTRYTLEQVFAFDDSGERLTDTERMRVALTGRSYRSGPTTMRRAWFPVARFTTGPGRLARRPPTPRIVVGRVSFRYGGGDCGPSSSLSLRVALPRGLRAGDGLEVEVKGLGVVGTAALTPGAAGTTVKVWLSDSLCNPDKVSLGAHGPFTARVAIRSITGSRSALSRWFQPRVARLRRPLRLPRVGVVSNRRTGHAAKTWLGATMIKPRTIKRSAPTGCTGGLVVGRRFKLTSSGAGDSYEAVRSVSWSHGQGWSVAGSSKHTGVDALLFGKTTATRQLTRRGYSVMGVRDARGAVLATIDYKPRPSRVIIHGFDRGGKRRWTTNLGHGKAQSRPRLALGRKRLLVTWWSARSILYLTMRWALLDRATGKVVATDGNKPGTGPRVGIDVQHGVTYSAGRFFVVYSGNRPRQMQPSIIVISARTGKQLAHRRLPNYGAGNGFDLAPAPGGGTALTFARRGQIYWQLLDRSGRVRGSSLRLSYATGSRNRKPRITRAGKLWAIGWEAYPGNQTYVTVVDAKGRHARPTPLAPGTRTSTVAVAPTGGNKSVFVAGYVERYGKARAALLRCSRSAPLGPPARIAAKP